MTSGDAVGAHPVDRARLTQFAAHAPPVHRYEPAPRHTPWVRHYWVPVWDLPAGTIVTEHVLQYPACLVVVTATYARFYGVVTGRSAVELAGRGWAVGMMLQPGAGPAVFGRSDLAHLTDSFVDLVSVPSMAPVISAVRQEMDHDPASVTAHRASLAHLEARLDLLPSLSDEARHVGDLVSMVEADADLLTVTQLSERAQVSQRQMQRLLSRYLGLTPKWLIQRRRLHEACDRLKAGRANLADLAHDLGYTDQAHFTRDFRKVTGSSPGAFARNRPK